MVLSLSRRDSNRMDLYRVSTVDVPESPLPTAQEVHGGSSVVIPCIIVKNDRVLYHQVSFLLSPCDYDLFSKVKEPLRGTRYNTRDQWRILINILGILQVSYAIILSTTATVALNFIYR